MDLPEIELKPWHYLIGLILLLLLLLAFLPPSEKHPQATPSPSPSSFIRNAQNYSGSSFSYSQQIISDGRTAKSTFSLNNFREIRLGLAEVIPAKFAKSVNNVSLESIPPILTKTLDFYPLIQYSSFSASNLSRGVSSNDADLDSAPLHLLVPPDLTEEQQQKLGAILRRIAFMDLTAEERAAIQKKWNELFDRSVAQNVSASDFLDAAEKLVDKIEELKANLFVPSPTASVASTPSATTAATPSASASASPSVTPSASASSTVFPTITASVTPTPQPSPRPLSQKEIEDIEINFPKNASSIFPDLPKEIILNVSENAPFDVKNYSLNYSNALGTPLLRVVGSAYKYSTARVSAGKRLVVDAFVDAPLNENGQFSFDSVTGEVRLAFSSAIDQEFKIPLKIVVNHVVNQEFDPDNMVSAGVSWTQPGWSAGLAGKRVFIDAGHTFGADPGAVSGSVLEAELNFIIASKVATLLQTAGAQVRVLDNRATRNIAIADRKQQANSFGADILVSFHHDCSICPSSVLVYVPVSGCSGNARCDESRKLAQQINNALSPVVGQSRGIVPDSSSRFPRLGILYPNAPAVLVEVTSVDNPKATQDSFRNSASQAIVNGIAAYFDAVTPSGSQNQPVSIQGFAFPVKCPESGENIYWGVTGTTGAVPHPSEGKFGSRSYGHSGTDFSAVMKQVNGEWVGRPVYAAESGTITHAGPYGVNSGNTVMITFDNGYRSQYLHLSEISVRVGQRVSKCQEVGKSGNTGNADYLPYSETHLHFILISTSGELVDPELNGFNANDLSKCCNSMQAAGSGKSVFVGPSISVQTIRRILELFNSPAVGSEQCFYDLSAKYQVDVAFLMAKFYFESGFGVAEGYPEHHAIGNIVTTAQGSQFCDSSKRVGSRFCGYADFCKAAEHFYYYLRNSRYYLPQGKTTPEDIEPIYGPCGDGSNNPYAYSCRVSACIQNWRAVDAGTAQLNKVCYPSSCANLHC
ncbi:MAG: N-acetylmuramoyl-L-alanine amidase [Candidatus Micrarchaeota archaeon]